MKPMKSKPVPTEVKCSACDGTGFPSVAQPADPGRKIFPPPCPRCLGKGRLSSS